MPAYSSPSPQSVLAIVFALALGLLMIFWVLTTFDTSRIETIAVVGGFSAATLAVVFIFYLIFR